MTDVTERRDVPFAELDEVDLFYTDIGDGPPVLLVHGWSCDSHDWTYQHDAFAERHRVIAPDLRGHGRSSVPESGYLPRVFAADLASLLERLATGPVVAIGHSLGGIIVSVLAIERPDLVSAVVAVDPAYATSLTLRDRVLANAGSYRVAGGLELAARTARALSARTTPAHLVTWHGRRVLGTPQHVVAETYAGIFEPEDQLGFDPPSSEYVQQRSCPVLAFYAAPTRADHERSLSTHASSHSVGWEGAGHWLHQERPAEFNALVLRWIDSLGTEGRPAP